MCLRKRWFSDPITVHHNRPETIAGLQHCSFVFPPRRVNSHLSIYFKWHGEICKKAKPTVTRKILDKSHDCRLWSGHHFHACNPEQCNGRNMTNCNYKPFSVQKMHVRTQDARLDWIGLCYISTKMASSNRVTKETGPSLSQFSHFSDTNLTYNMKITQKLSGRISKLVWFQLFLIQGNFGQDST